MKFKNGAEIVTANFWDDMFEGGYIKPEELLEYPEDAYAVQEAIELLLRFKNAGEEQEIIDYL